MLSFNDTVDVIWPPSGVRFGLPGPKTSVRGPTGWCAVCRLGGVGDNLIAASVLGPLKALGYKVDVITETPYHVVFENNPYIDKLSVKDGKTDLPQGDMKEWQLWFAERGREYDFLINLSHSCEVLIAANPAMSLFWWPKHFRRSFCNRNYLEAVHDIVGVTHQFGRLYWSTDQEIDRAMETRAEVTNQFGDGRVIGWCLSGTRVDKIYPWAKMAIAWILRELKIPVVMMGAPTEKDHGLAREIIEYVEKQNGNRKGLHLAISLDANKPNWPLRRILTFAQNACDLIIGPDTGPSWAVAMEETPKIILLSHASPHNITHHWVNTTTLHANPNYVKCWPCHQLHDSLDTCSPNAEKTAAACMSQISVDLVLLAVKASLGCEASSKAMRENWKSNVVMPETKDTTNGLVNAENMGNQHLGS